MTSQERKTPEWSGFDLSKVAKTIELLSKGNHISVGDTPNDIVSETRLYRLLHYHSLVKRVSSTPILVVYALVNRSYVLDLQPNKSWIRHLLMQGFDVYLLDWKSPTRIDKYVSFDDYVNSYIDDCVEIVQNNNSSDKITLHGYCMGSSMSAMYTSLHQEKIQNLVTIAPVIDTSKDTTVIANISKQMDIDKLVSYIGYLPPEKLYECYSILKPFKQGVNKYFNLIENIDNETFVQNFLRIEKWLYDTPPIAGETIKQWINDIYKKNLLVKNQFKLGTTIVDLKKINVPLLNIVAEEDHLVSPECSVPLNEVVSSEDKRLIRFHTGHVGLIASSYSQNNVLPKVGQWIKSRSN
ncbi:MAG: class III poly(R)-hydroxyalkanoic acid synthase subunit PhaC [Nitrososphaeraceae archaeon]|nr:class III poly(R)-hydroxyalkanoic acid synthase subunit PhaC [Nitrososphaeraceae archaeon]MDW0169038.1 class III poly(R)-hydroxyalkanoic acid synthase subunit PhaC [Nitrososphaeraceae archaeon]MDW0172282.1 class III poly(R)-hydroxyalkanoic acid synthase subunit PhaC [Nitrososphaeraceae archaeon]MDW0173628.1 class III poly(R)-hydroxyalkanoic acid synthase subunit PhaC [Nitrososphaeraceae archaeon]MDW0175213.1 class III poly(R)-hydroxyalkanoic acid synthase subunit PhaC [Nitrososphaeraceae arc